MAGQFGPAMMVICNHSFKLPQWAVLFFGEGDMSCQDAEERNGEFAEMVLHCVFCGAVARIQGR